MEQTAHELVAKSIRDEIPYYGKGDIIDHLYNEGFTEYLMDVLYEDFPEIEDVPYETMVEDWHEIRDEVIDEEIEKIDWE